MTAAEATHVIRDGDKIVTSAAGTFMYKFRKYKISKSNSLPGPRT